MSNINTLLRHNDTTVKHCIAFIHLRGTHYIRFMKRSGINIQRLGKIEQKSIFCVNFKLKRKIGMNFSIYEQKIFNFLNNANLSKREKAALQYGLYVALDFIKKGFFVYLIAFLFGTVFETFLLHLGYFFIRQVTYGWHFTSNFSCYIGSIFVFSGLPIFISSIHFNQYFLIVLTVIVSIFLYLIGPVETEISKISNKRKTILKSKLKKRLFFIVLLSIVVPSKWFVFIVCGLVIQLLTLHIQYFKNRRGLNG